MALTDLTRISTSGIATGTSLSGAILHGDAHFRGTQVGVTSALFDSSDNALEFNDNVKIKLGNSGDLSIYHTGGNSIIRDQGTGTLSLQSNGTEIALYNYANSQYMGKFANNAQVELYYAGNKKFETTQTGAVVTGVLTATTFSGNLVGGGSGISTFYDLRVTNNLTVEGTTSTLDTTLIGVDRVEVGANSNSIVGVAVTQSGTADIVRLFDGASQVVTVDDVGRVGLGSAIPAARLDVSPTIQVKNTALNGSANVDINAANGGQARLNLYAGVSGGVNRAARIDFHNQGNTPQWMLINDFSQNGGNEFSIRHGSEHAISCTPDGTVSLYDDGDESLRTDVAGILVPEKVIHLGDSDTFISFPSNDSFSVTTNNVTRMTFTGNFIDLPDAGTFRFGGSQDLKIYHGSGGASNIVHSNTSQPLIISATGAGSIRFDTNSNERLRITNSGVIGAGGVPIAASASNGVGNAGTFQFYHINTSGNYASAGKIQSVATGAFSGSTSTWDADLVFSSVLNSTETERLRITSDGDVGISSTSPRARLDVKDANTGHPVILRVSADNATPYALVVGNDDHNTDANNGLAMWIGGSKTHHIQARTSETASENKLEIEAYDITLQTGTNMNQNFYFDSSGRLKIGTSTEGTGSGDNLTIADSGNMGMTLRSTDSNYCNIYFSDATSGTAEYEGYVSYSHSNNSLEFATSHTEKLRITSDGYIGLGTGGNTSPTAPLSVKVGSGGEYFLDVMGSSTKQFGLYYDQSSWGSAEFGIHEFDNSGNPYRRFTIANSGKVGINETSPDNLLHVTTNSSTAYSTSAVNTVNSANAILRLENTNGGDGSGVNNYVGVYFRVANGANSDAQLQYVRTGDNAGAFHFKARNSGTSYPNLVTMKSDGNMGVGVLEPKSKLHLGSTGDIRFGSQYGGFAHIMHQMQYAVGYTGTHWQFETNNQMSWCFDGVLIVYGGGGSTYGSEVTKITIVYSRENGPNNSGDMWRNGTTSYNVETLGHGQVGLNPGSGELTVTEDTAPDGAASQRSLLKLGWTQPGHGGATTIWSKLHGTFYWGTGSSGNVEIQDKDGTIVWNSNP